MRSTLCRFVRHDPRFRHACNNTGSSKLPKVGENVIMCIISPISQNDGAHHKTKAGIYPPPGFSGMRNHGKQEITCRQGVTLSGKEDLTCNFIKVNKTPGNAISGLPCLAIQGTRCDARCNGMWQAPVQCDTTSRYRQQRSYAMKIRK